MTWEIFLKNKDSNILMLITRGRFSGGGSGRAAGATWSGRGRVENLMQRDAQSNDFECNCNQVVSTFYFLYFYYFFEPSIILSISSRSFLSASLCKCLLCLCPLPTQGGRQGIQSLTYFIYLYKGVKHKNSRLTFSYNNNT